MQLASGEAKLKDRETQVEARRPEQLTDAATASTKGWVSYGFLHPQCMFENNSQVWIHLEIDLILVRLQASHPNCGFRPL